jgi:Nif-specific regulatory protein
LAANHLLWSLSVFRSFRRNLRKFAETRLFPNVTCYRGKKEVVAMSDRFGNAKQLHGLVGESNCMQKLKADVKRFASEPSTVLITGETGSGKECIARALHELGSNAGRPYVTVNCAAIPESTAESEFFGHEKGAFTGAFEQRIGKFESASEGSIFLDEIGELSLPLQAKLLRVLEGHAFERIGGNNQLRNRSRVIAATNRNLREEVRQKQFREDLLYRLSVLTVRVPPLRERGNDVLLLAEHFLHEQSALRGREYRFSDGARTAMIRYHWPGNVRELKNSVERATALATGDELREDDLGIGDRPLPDCGPQYYAVEPFSPLPLKEVERQHIQRTYQYAGGNYTKAAELLDVHRATVKRRLQPTQSK